MELEYQTVTFQNEERVEKRLTGVNSEKPSGLDNLQRETIKIGCCIYCIAYMPYFKSEFEGGCMPPGLEICQQEGHLYTS